MLLGPTLLSISIEIGFYLVFTGRQKKNRAAVLLGPTLLSILILIGFYLVLLGFSCAVSSLGQVLVSSIRCVPCFT